LRLVKHVAYRQFIKKCEAVKTRRFWDYRDGAVIVVELPTGGHEATSGEFTYMFRSAFNLNDMLGWGAKSKFFKY
jgi:hypothetical protein